MKKDHRRLFALLMALALILQYSVGAGYLSVYAEEEKTDTEVIQTENEGTEADVSGNASDAYEVPSWNGEYDPVNEPGKVYTMHEPKRPGYWCLRWSSDPNATVKEYGSGDSVDVKNHPKKNSNVILTLYAVWEINAEIYYKSDGESKGTVSSAFDLIHPGNPEPEGSTATPEPGYVFREWRDKNGVIVSKDQVFKPEKVGGVYLNNTYTAYFEPITYTVKFETNGGSAVAAQTVSVNSGWKATKPEAPTKGVCYGFDGWYADEELTKQFDFSKVITEDTTVYAKWNANLQNHITKQEKQDPSCDTAGNIAYWTCSVCNGYFSDADGKTEISQADTVVPALGHKYELVTSDVEPATCTDAGKHHETIRCSTCGALFYDSEGVWQVEEKSLWLPATGHLMRETTVSEVPATCTSVGRRIQLERCLRCGEVSGSPIVTTLDRDPDAHNWGEWEVVKAATDDEAGLMVRVCANDPSHTEEKVIPKNNSVISYDLNGGTLDGQTGIVTITAKRGSTITLPEPAREGYVFDYWKGSVYKAGDKYTVTEDHTFTAQWKEASSGDTDKDDADKDQKEASSGKSVTRGVNTGDASHLMMWIMITIMAEAGLAYIVRRRRSH